MVEDDGSAVTPGTMPAATCRDKPRAAEPPPRAYGPRGIGVLMARVTRPGFRRRSPAAAQIMADWLAVMGPDLARRTTPQKLSAGTLTIGCAGPAAMELQHLAPQILDRINAHIGARGEKAEVKRLRFVHQNPPAAPAAASPPAPARAARPLPPIDLEPGPLRDALARLGQVLEDRRTGAPPSAISTASVSSANAHKI